MLKPDLEYNNEHVLQIDQLQSFTVVTFLKNVFYNC